MEHEERETVEHVGFKCSGSRGAGEALKLRSRSKAVQEFSLDVLLQGVINGGTAALWSFGRQTGILQRIRGQRSHVLVGCGD